MRLKVAVVGIVLLLVAGAIRSHLAVQHEISTQKATGLGAVADVGWDPISIWKQSSFGGALKEAAAGVVGGVPGGIASSARVRPAAVMTFLNAEQLEPERKMIRSASLSLVVGDVRVAVSKVTDLAGWLKGGVDSSTIDGSDAASARMKIRVPDHQLDAALQQIRQVAIKVESETIETRDVTREYVDMAARLRNFHSEEQQYLQILRKASTVKDTFEVSEKLSEVRGKIEELQSQINSIEHEVAMSAVNISITRQSEMQVLGIEWRPLYNAKVAARGVIVGFADWLDWVVNAIMNIPLIALWVATIVLVLWICAQCGKWLLNVLFPNTRWAWRKKTLPTVTNES